MAMHGPEIWTLDSPSRDDVLSSVFACVKNWPITRDHGHAVAYFEEELTMMEQHDSPELQYFALWTLVSFMHKAPG